MIVHSSNLFKFNGIHKFSFLEAKIHHHGSVTGPRFVYPYNLGWKRNIRYVLGSYSGRPEGNGYWWPVLEGCDQYTLTVHCNLLLLPFRVNAIWHWKGGNERHPLFCQRKELIKNFMFTRISCLLIFIAHFPHSLSGCHQWEKEKNELWFCEREETLQFWKFIFSL